MFNVQFLRNLYFVAQYLGHQWSRVPFGRFLKYFLSVGRNCISCEEIDSLCKKWTDPGWSTLKKNLRLLEKRTKSTNTSADHHTDSIPGAFIKIKLSCMDCLVCCSERKLGEPVHSARFAAV